MSAPGSRMTTTLRYFELAHDNHPDSHKGLAVEYLDEMDHTGESALYRTLRELDTRPDDYPFAEFQDLRVLLEGLVSSLAECAADVHDIDALQQMRAALREALR